MLKKLLIKNRSYRGFKKDTAISKDELFQIVDHVRYCPSSLNRQPFQYAILWKKDKVEGILKWTKWAGMLPKLELPYPDRKPPAIIIILQNLLIDENKTRYLRDAGIVAHTILLAATERGFGGCMIGNFNVTKVKEELMLPDYLVPVLVVALGKPYEKIELVNIKEGEDTAYYRDLKGVHYVPKRRLEDIIYIPDSASNVRE